MKVTKFKAVYGETLELVDVIKVKRELGVRYIVFWDDDSEPTVYLASEYSSKFVDNEDQNK